MNLVKTNMDSIDRAYLERRKEEERHEMGKSDCREQVSGLVSIL